MNQPRYYILLFLCFTISTIQAQTNKTGVSKQKTHQSKVENEVTSFEAKLNILQKAIKEGNINKISNYQQKLFAVVQQETNKTQAKLKQAQRNDKVVTEGASKTDLSAIQQRANQQQMILNKLGPLTAATPAENPLTSLELLQQFKKTLPAKDSNSTNFSKQKLKVLEEN